MSVNEKIEAVKLRIKNITEHFHYSEDVINILTICYMAINNIFYILDELLEKFSKGIDHNIYDYIEKDREYETLSFDEATIEKMTL